MKNNPVIILVVIVILIGLSWDSIKEDKYSSTSSTTSTTLYDDSSYVYEDTQLEATRLQERLETEALDKTRSPYYQKISLSYISSLNNPDPSSEYLTINTYLNQDEMVNITGWTLRSELTGNWVRIGGASYLPTPNVASYGDVILKQNDVVYLIKGFSPIGISFRSNKCTGYLGEYRTFYPYINMSCPAPRNEKLPKFSDNLDREDECIELIESVSACRTPSSYMNFNNLPDTVTDSCKNYLREKINYGACVATHISDKDFAGREWYIYMNLFGPLWRNKREKITLYDSQGLVVNYIEVNY